MAMAKPYMRHMDAAPDVGETCEVLSPYDGWIAVIVEGHDADWIQFTLPDGQKAGAELSRFRPLSSDVGRIERHAA